MKSFDNTRDSIEREFKDGILKHFPNYARFWEEFIGFAGKEPINLRPYGLIFPTTTNPPNEKRIKSAYLDINNIHYHLFVSLAGAHYFLETFMKTKNCKTDFEFFLTENSLTHFYLSLGICRDMVNRLVAEILVELCQEISKKPRTLQEYLDSFVVYLKQNHQTDLSNDFKTWKEKVSMFRTRLSHYGEIAKGITYTPQGREIFIPKDLAKRKPYFDDFERIKIGEVEEASNAMVQGLIMTEKLLNRLYLEVFIPKYRDFLKKANIRINYNN